MILALAVHKRWSVYQLDMKSAFLHSELNEAVFIEQPRGYDKKSRIMTTRNKAKRRDHNREFLKPSTGCLFETI